MAIAREGDFLVSRSMGNTPHIGIESGRLKQCVDEADHRGYRGVFGAPVFGFAERSLDFLRRLPKIEEVWFWDVELADVSAIYELPNLTSFGIHPKRPAVDFTRLPNLTSVVVTPVTGDRRLSTLKKLSSLAVWHFNPRSKRFDDFALPQGPDRLELNWANILTLNGLVGGRGTP